ncbi:hypothetical protein L1887_25246 [Cichorium endivia]|nr:hypothetical protein L1887_25246 [Cichorium endivia]
MSCVRTSKRITDLISVQIEPVGSIFGFQNTDDVITLLLNVLIFLSIEDGRLEALPLLPLGPRSTCTLDYTYFHRVTYFHLLNF